jgi:hypothetical protein
MGKRSAQPRAERRSPQAWWNFMGWYYLRATGLSTSRLAFSIDSILAETSQVES